MFGSGKPCRMTWRMTIGTATMNHIILTAFGTGAAAKDTYHLLETQVTARFPDADLHWFHSSPTNRRQDDKQPARSALLLGDLLDTLPSGQHCSVVVQSLHLTPGSEFHRMVRETSASGTGAVIGMPLLSAPDDFRRVARCLLPLLPKPGDQGVLLIGHGTCHPSWTVYPVLEQTLRNEVGPHIFVATLGHYPESDSVIADIAAAGYRRLLVIPLLLAAGTHFRRDIAGRQPGSWSSRLADRGIRPTFHNQGLGVLPGIADIFSDHIQDAFERLNTPPPKAPC